MPQRQRPLFGIVTTAVAAQDDPEVLQGEYKPSNSWCYLERQAYELGLRACLFRPEDLDTGRQTITGWVRDRTKRGDVWQREELRLPDVVYENVYVSQSGTPLVRRLRSYFANRGIPNFNPSLGNKIGITRWLKRYEKLWQHYPETLLMPREQEVLDFLKKIGRSIYLKPASGNSGTGILEVSESTIGRYLVRAAKFGPQNKPFESMMSERELLDLLREEFQRTNFIVQEGCDLLHVDGGKIDLRTHLQRNRHGEWESVALVVKQGQRGSIVSNYHAGGATHDWAWLQDQARQRWMRLPDQQQVIDLSMRTAEAFTDKAWNLPSIGLDIGIDTQARLWLLDINNRPGRNILDADQKLRCHRLNAEFALYLLKNKDREDKT